MGFFTFNKIPNHRVFNYRPRFYDPEKDARDAIIRQAKIEAGLIDEEDLDHDVERAKLKISKAYQNQNVVGNYKRTSQRKSNIRLAIIIILLSGITYILLNFNIDFLVKLIE